MGNRKLKKTASKISKKIVPLNVTLIAPMLLRISVLMSPFAFLLIFFLPSYFPFTAGRIMVFSGSDGNCVAGEPTFGNHCFGDYGVPLNFIQDSENPWSIGSPLAQFPPLNMILMSLFAFISNSINNASSLTLYLTTILISVLYPIAHASRKLVKAEQRIYILFLGLLTMPLITAIDRGNNLVWSIPFVYLAILSIVGNRHDHAIVFLSLAMAIRPQNAIFLLLFLMSRHYVSILKTCVLTIIIYLLGFAIYLKHLDFEVLVIYLNAIIQYGSGIPGTWPPNISLARGIKVVLDWLSVETDDTVTILIANVIIFCALTCIIFLKGNLKITSGAILLIPIVFLAAPMTWYYYGTFLVIAVAVIIDKNLSIEDLFVQKNLSYLFVGGILMTNSVLLLPMLEDYNNLVQYLVPVYWLFFYISFITQSLLSTIKVRRNRNASK